MVSRRRDTPPSHERRAVQLALFAGLPALLVALVLLWVGHYSLKVQWTLALVMVGTWLITAAVLREHVVRPLQTLSNMLGALREGDYSIRARAAERDDALGIAMLEANLLGETLRAQRLGAMEATALLRSVMSEIDVAVFAFDDADRVRLVNRAGSRLLGQSVERLLGRTADQVGLADALQGEAPRAMDVTFAGGAGRWELRRGSFRQDGRPHTLVVLADVTRTLREEELKAWQRLVRVLSHEINNSLAPIKSIAGSLQGMLGQRPFPNDAEEDLRRGLGVIATRSDALGRFMSSYARLARLPAPRRAPVDVRALVQRVAALESRVPIEIEDGPTMTLEADADQLEQLLINVVRNAADAALETKGGVRVRWAQRGGAFILQVEDDGAGLASSANLFVPFFTTKPNGSGIGLVVCRQIAEAHGGSFAVENRANTHGCLATLKLPSHG